MKKKILLFGIPTMLVILIAINVALEWDNIFSEAIIDTPSQDNQHLISEDDSSDENDNEISDDSPPSTIKFHIGQADVTLDDGFEIINKDCRELVRNFTRINLLGYGGKGCLEDIKKINDMIFAKDSPNREDYATRMAAYEDGTHGTYSQGYSEVKFCGNFEKDNTTLSFTIRINHTLTCYDLEKNMAYDTITTSAIYTLTLVQRDDTVSILYCQPDKRNAFDGEKGCHEVKDSGALIDISEVDMQILTENTQLTKPEKDVLRKFYTEVVYAFGGYAYLDDIKDIEEQIFENSSTEKYDYMKRIEMVPAFRSIHSEISRIKDISGTPEERTLSFSVLIQTINSYDEVSGFENVYTLTLKYVNDKVLIVSCKPHEMNFYE